MAKKKSKKRKVEKISILNEAVCEFRYQSQKLWDNTQPGLLYSKIKDEYPIKESGIVSEWGLELNPQEGKTTQIEKRGIRSRFLNEGRTAIVTVYEHNLGISSLKPYVGWDNFLQEIIKIYTLYDDLVTKEDGLLRIGMRYINVIPSQNDDDPLRYVNFKPQVSDSYSNPVRFLFQADYPLNAESDHLVCEGRTKVNIVKEIQKEGPSVFIDIDASFTKLLTKRDPEEGAEFPQDDILFVLKELHNSVKDIFKGVINDDALAEFDIDLSE